MIKQGKRWSLFPVGLAIVLVLVSALAFSLCPAEARANVTAQVSDPHDLTCMSVKTKELTSNYVGKYRRLVYTAKSRGSIVGQLPAGSLYSERILNIKSIKDNIVTFKVTYWNAWIATMDTGVIRAKAANNKASFKFVTDWGERGKGYLKFLKGKKVKLFMRVTYHPSGISQSIGLAVPVTMKKGTQKYRS